MITNPECLYRTPESEQQFNAALKNYIRHIVGIEIEGEQYGANEDHRTNSKASENGGS